MEIGPRSAALALFAQRLTARSPLGEAERAALLALPGTPQSIAARRDFTRMGEEQQHVCLVTHGIVARFAQLSDGNRQIIGFYLPGDMADLYSLMLPRTISPLEALTHCGILKVPHRALRDLAFEHQALASAFWRDCLVDGQIVAQWLVNLGRRDARARAAHLLCEMAVRFRFIGLLQHGMFPFSVTQEQLSEALGMTSVHVNRSLKVLREEGLIRLNRTHATILDWTGLQAAADFNPDYLHLAPPSADAARARGG